MPDSLDVKVDHARVWVGGVLIADRGGRWPLWTERIIESTRERTPVEWWRRAAEIEAATADLGTGGPVGEGVDYFIDNADLAFPPEVRANIQENAYEAAREVILAGIDEHARRLLPALSACASSRGESAARLLELHR